MTLRRIIVFILLLVLPAGLISAQTDTPEPTLPPTPSHTPLPTNTPVPTATLTPTTTPTPDKSGLVPVGSIMAYGGRPDAGHYPPDGWLACDGHAVYRDEYPELFSVIADQYGPGDGSTTFNLPDCRSRFLMGAGQGLGLSNHIVSDYGGNETHTLTITEMPPHSHTGVVSPNNPLANRALVSSGGAQTVRPAGTSDETGGGAAFTIMNPFLTIAYYIFAGSDTVPTSPEIEITVVIVFPSHTPTSTATETLTPTTGPSPTDTATPTETPISEVGYQVGDQTVRIINQVTPGELVIVGFLAVVIGLLITMFLYLIRRR